MSTPSFFDFAMENQGGKKSIKFLEEMKAHIPYEALEKLLIEEGVYRPKEAGKPGRLIRLYYMIQRNPTKITQYQEGDFYAKRRNGETIP